MKLRSLITIFSVVLILCSSSLVNAAEVNTKNPKPSEESVVKAFVVKDGELSEITLEQYYAEISKAEVNEHLKQQEKLNAINNNPNIAPREIGIMSLLDLSYYYEQGYIDHVLRTGLKRRISPVLENSTSSAATRTLSYSTTQAYTANISITASRKGYIDAGITGGAGWSKSTSTNDSTTATVQPKKFLWMDFTPYMDNSYGTLNEVIYSVDPLSGTSVLIKNESSFADIYIPLELNNMADGVYTIVESSTRPN